MTTSETNLSLRPNVTRGEAIHAFASRGLRNWRMVQKLSPLRSVAELYVPFRLFRTAIQHRDTNDVRWLAADLFTGALDPFTFDEVPGDARFVPVTSRNRLECSLDSRQVESALATKLQRTLFQCGFFRVGGLNIRMEPAIDIFYMPYWIGLFGAGDRASIEVLDATRRRFEGNKFRAGIRKWLCSPPIDAKAI
jgi:hypothetical protein